MRAGAPPWSRWCHGSGTTPTFNSRWFYVPAVLAMILMILTMVLSSMGVVREKEIGTMEQLVVTPIKPWQLIVGKLAPFGLIGVIVTFLVTGVAVLWFGVPLRGSLALLVALTLLLLLNTLGMGLLVSTIARTQQQAMMGSVFALLLPQVYLSGLIFPIANMPEPIQYANLRHPAALLRHHPARDLPEGSRHRRALARGRGAGGVRPGVPDAGGDAISKAYLTGNACSLQLL